MITLRLPLTQNRNCTVTLVYALTMTNNLNKINHFYTQLHEPLKNILNFDKVILIGGFKCLSWQ